MRPVRARTEEEEEAAAMKSPRADESVRTARR